MDIALGFLTFGTLGFVMVFAYLEARATDEKHRRVGPKSSLSRDGAAERLAMRRAAAQESES